MINSKEKAPIFSINAQYSFPSGNLKYEIYSHPNIDAIFSSSSRVNFPVFILCEKPGCDIPKRFASSVMLISAWIAAVFICSCIVKILSLSLLFPALRRDPFFLFYFMRPALASLFFVAVLCIYTGLEPPLPALQRRNVSGLFQYALQRTWDFNPLVICIVNDAKKNHRLLSDQCILQYIHHRIH